MKRTASDIHSVNKEEHVKSAILSFKALTLLIIILTLSLCFIGPQEALSASAQEIDIRVDAALKRFTKEVEGGSEFLKKAEAVLTFPRVIKAGAIIGGEYGEGALRIKGKTEQYYSTVSASLGFQLGAQSKSLVLVFLSKKALSDFRNSNGWKAGVDGSVAVIKWGAGEDINTVDIKDPIVGFVFGNKGLMYNLTIEGSKFSKIEK
jgi:lipid-binding SYLF domain-containing protein